MYICWTAGLVAAWGGMELYATLQGSGIIEVFGFFKSLELFDDAVGIFGIVFSNPCFNAGSIKQNQGCLFDIDALAYGFGQINESVKHSLQVWGEILLKTGKSGSIRNRRKTAEIP